MSKTLLQVCVDDGDGGFELSPLFADDFDDYSWHYDNDGLRLAQRRFYPLESGGSTGDPCTPGGLLLPLLHLHRAMIRSAAL